MGNCGSSSHRSVAPPNPSEKPDAQQVADQKLSEEASQSEGVFLSKWEAGYLLPDNPGGAVNTYEDYRGLEVTTTNSVSRSKTDTICRWADAALEGRAQYGNIFFNPQNPKQWPREVIDTYDPNDFFAAGRP